MGDMDMGGMMAQFMPMVEAKYNSLDHEQVKNQFLSFFLNTVTRCTETSWKTTPDSSNDILSSATSEAMASSPQRMISLAAKRPLISFNRKYSFNELTKLIA